MTKHTTRRAPIEKLHFDKSGNFLSRSLVDRFWESVDRRAPDECWEWQGSTTKGYGVIGTGQRTLRAHRVSYEINVGPIPDKLCCLHKCDNPACVNPSHLFLGTIADNNRDKAEKGRHLHGETHRCAKLTEAEVTVIRHLAADGLGRRRLAAIYGVSQYTVRDIVRRKTWVHI